MAVFTTKQKQVVNNPGTGTIEKEILGVDPAVFQGTNDLLAQITCIRCSSVRSTSTWGTTRPITC